MAEEKNQEEKKEAKVDEAPSGGSVEVPVKYTSIVEEIEKMSVLDLSELVKILEDKFGVSATAPVAAVAVAGGEAAEEAEEKSAFDIEITDAGANKISVIKVIREITEKGLKEAKDLVDAAPKVVAEGVAKEEAEAQKAKLEEAGAQVTLK